MSLVTLGRADFLSSALACIIMRFPDMSSRAGPASPARSETAYNPDNRSSKNISSCDSVNTFSQNQIVSILFRKIKNLPFGSR